MVIAGPPAPRVLGSASSSLQAGIVPSRACRGGPRGPERGCGGAEVAQAARGRPRPRGPVLSIAPLGPRAAASRGLSPARGCPQEESVARPWVPEHHAVVPAECWDP